MVIFLSSRLRGSTKVEYELNQSLARYFGLFVAENFGYPTIIPHITYTQFLDDHNELHRGLALEFCKELIGICDELWVFIINGRISEGMKIEIDKAKELGKPVKYIHLSTSSNFGENDFGKISMSNPEFYCTNDKKILDVIQDKYNGDAFLANTPWEGK